MNRQDYLYKLAVLKAMDRELLAKKLFGLFVTKEIEKPLKEPRRNKDGSQ